MKRSLSRCAHKSCRFQMAERLVNHHLKDRFQAFSTDTESTRVNPLMSRMMIGLVHVGSNGAGFLVRSDRIKTRFKESYGEN